MQSKAVLIMIVAAFLTGCNYVSSVFPSEASGNSITSTDDLTPAADGSEQITFNGITKRANELSEDTLRWLEWYQSLPEDKRDALSFVPNEFVTSGVVAMETDATEAPPYLASLTEEELLETEELARFYFTEASTGFAGVESIYPADDNNPLYQNTGIEAEYDPGNIIIYMVLTGKDQAAGDPMRSISIARRSKSDSRKVINSGH